jgi:hypothetical protein
MQNKKIKAEGLRQNNVLQQPAAFLANRKTALCRRGFSVKKY